MDLILIEKIRNSSAHRKSREDNANFILSTPTLLDTLLEMVFDIEDPDNHKACWILELVVERELNWIALHIDRFCDSLPLFKNNSALRSISKIAMFLTYKYPLTPDQDQKIINASFDWLINEKVKVATKAYAIRTLFKMGLKYQWIDLELKRIISEDYYKHSAAYQAVTKEILKKLL